MSRLRDTVVVTLTGSGRIVDLSARRHHHHADARTQPVRVLVVNRRALEVALDLAGGDPARLRFEIDGSITVANKSRTTR